MCILNPPFKFIYLKEHEQFIETTNSNQCIDNTITVHLIMLDVLLLLFHRIFESIILMAHLLSYFYTKHVSVNPFWLVTCKNFLGQYKTLLLYKEEQTNPFNCLFLRLFQHVLVKHFVADSHFILTAQNVRVEICKAFDISGPIFHDLCIQIKTFELRIYLDMMRSKRPKSCIPQYV